ncbi:Eukaryotic peptide chain release factor subunit 1-3 [Striga hermonthica]|uniref:Eukaryotic peptide chain release factor subunit 1-3 n=1 Tax=Striga hermonthica TaxID=68872 RepID=A0A9N7RQ62_STRHE|nr:Eukaryotic peptide chain release factor subunit 1-3 [Striga hermonthica]
MFDPRLQAKILNAVDVSYGGENGFNQAIELSTDILSNVKFIQEKCLIRKYFEGNGQDTGKYVFGVDDTMKVLEMGAVETLIVWENLDMTRFILKNTTTGKILIKNLTKDQAADQKKFRDATMNAELEAQENILLLEWFANEYWKFGCTLEFVINKCQEGSQFCRGFCWMSMHLMNFRVTVNFSRNLNRSQPTLVMPVGQGWPPTGERLSWRLIGLARGERFEVAKGVCCFLVYARVLEDSRSHVEVVEQRLASKEMLTDELTQDDVGLSENVVEDVKEKERAEEQEDVEK